MVRKNLLFMLLAGGLLASFSLGVQAKAPVTGKAPGLAAEAQLGQLENRYFFRQYLTDPVEKRLERLELMVFGAMQAGTVEQRFNKLVQTVNERVAQSAKESEAKKGKDDTPTKGSATPGQSSSQYPVLNTLEWRVLKKTYPDESLDQRLERLETKLFGQGSPTMAYIDRVDRLKRTVGIDMPQTSSRPVGPPVATGPMPRARPRTPGFGMSPYPDEFFNGAPGLGAFPNVADIFRKMNQQMEEMLNMPPGYYQFDPDSGTWTKPEGAEPMPYRRSRPDLPSMPQPLPPYTDPNSI